MRAAHERYAAPAWLDELEPTPPVSQEDIDTLRPRRITDNERRATVGPGVVVTDLAVRADDAPQRRHDATRRSSAPSALAGPRRGSAALLELVPHLLVWVSMLRYSRYG